MWRGSRCFLTCFVSECSSRSLTLKASSNFSCAMPPSSSSIPQHELELEQDLYSNAFVSCLDFDRHGAGDTSGHGTHTPVDQCFGVMGMFAIAAVQVLSLISVEAHIQTNMIGRKLDHLYMVYERFLGTNGTMPMQLSQLICGSYEQMEIRGNATNSHLQMPDGTTYSATEAYPLFYNFKMPGDSWTIARLGGDEMSMLDNMLYVIHDGMFGKSAKLFTSSVGWVNNDNPLQTGVFGYAELFILMTSIMLFTSIVEFRKIYAFACMLHSFINGGMSTEERSYEYRHESEGSSPISPFTNRRKIGIVALSKRAIFVGFASVLLRVIIAGMVMVVGCHFLLNTVLKLDLIFNSLALVFILEFDNVVYAAVASRGRLKLVQKIDCIRYRDIPLFPSSWWPSRFASRMWISFPTVCFVCVLGASVACRAHQIYIFEARFNMLEALCLFVGPTPGGREDIVAPATGLCESLLSATCAPNVTGPGARHGPCVVSDFGAFYDPIVMLHADGRLFENMEDKKGRRKPWIKWGNPRLELLESGMWTRGVYQDTARMICSLMYQPTGTVDTRIVDSDTGEIMQGAPFYCDKALLMQAIFGKHMKGLKSTSEKPNVRRFVESVAFIARQRKRWHDFRRIEPEVSAVFDRCRKPVRRIAGDTDVELLPSKRGENSGRYQVNLRANSWRMRRAHPKLARPSLRRRLRRSRLLEPDSEPEFLTKVE